MSSWEANTIISNLTRAVCPVQCERADNQCPLQSGNKNVRAERGKLQPIIFMSWLCPGYGFLIFLSHQNWPYSTLIVSIVFSPLSLQPGQGWCWGSVLRGTRAKWRSDRVTGSTWGDGTGPTLQSGLVNNGPAQWRDCQIITTKITGLFSCKT